MSVSTSIDFLNDEQTREAVVSTRRTVVRGLVFDARLRDLAIPALLGRVSPYAAVAVRPAARLRKLEPPMLPGPAWARLEPVVTGICGSDVVEMALQADFDNPLRHLVGFPHVMGHEIVARVLTPPQGAGTMRAGDLVVVDPWLGCEVFDRTPCAGCARGMPPQCVHNGEHGDNVGGGMHLGNVPGLPGGFATELVAHGSRLHSLPDAVPVAAGVLADPLAVALHAIERGEADGGPVLVLGAGTIGLCIAAALRARDPEAAVLVSARWPHAVEEVRRLGAIPVPVTHGDAVAAVRTHAGGRAVRAAAGRTWLLGGGAPVIFDTIASAETAQLALACAASCARIVEVGVHRPRRTETTLRYFKEVELRGVNGYGRLRDGRRAIDAAIRLLATGVVPGERWITHRFPLAKWRRAFTTAAAPGRSHAIKVTIWPADEEPRP